MDMDKLCSLLFMVFGGHGCSLSGSFVMEPLALMFIKQAIRFLSPSFQKKNAGMGK